MNQPISKECQHISTHISAFFQNHERVSISPIAPKGWSAKTMRGSLFPLFPLFWWSMPCHLVKTWATKIGEIGTLSMFSLGEVPKAWEGPYFPVFPLRVKCQNHERVPISPILVVHVLTGWIDIGHQNRGNRDPFMVLAFSPISFKGEVPKPWEGPYFPYFPYFGGPCLGKMKR